MTAIAPASLLLVIAALASGCASDPQASAKEPKEQPEYRTGSNLPVRNTRPTTEAERERAKADLEEIRRSGGLSQQPK